MTPVVPDLWPPDFGTSSLPSPASILRQQAHILGQRTRNVVVGEIESHSGKVDGSVQFRHEFSLTAPLLDFQERILHIRHGVEVYPVELVPYDGGGLPGTSIRAGNAEQFIEALKNQLAT